MRRVALGALVAALAAAPLGPARAQKPPAPASQPTFTPPPVPRKVVVPKALSARELEALADAEEVERRYEEASGVHISRMKQILRREYEDRLKQLDQRYSKGIDEADKEFRRRHLSAMELIKQFLAKYPNDPKWTPDAMFRLADLYLDQAKWEFDDRVAAGSVNTAPVDDNPDAPPKYNGPDYLPSLQVWREIVTRFPSYRQIDGTVYLLAYYLGEMRDLPRAKQAYLGLVCRNKFDPLAVPPPPPDPKDIRARAARAAAPKNKIFVDPYQGCVPMKDSPDLTDESWVRVGEAHFDTRGELDLAIAAYQHVALNAKSKFYDIALYKLAWSYYRNNQYMEGIKAFDELVAYSDKLEEQGNPPTDLRKEAVQYLAISFSEPWEEGAQPDPQKSLTRINAFYNGRTAERHVRDVYEQLGDTLRLSAGQPAAGEVPPEIRVAYQSAIDSWRFTLKNWPLHPRNPLVHQKIVDALAFMGDANAAAEERRNLAIAYKKDPPPGLTNWYAANETNREAMDWATRLGETSLIEAARTMHRNAQIAKLAYGRAPTPEGKAGYLKLYAQAAELYQQYVATYPTATEVYDLTYRLADCLFFSEQYEAAVAPYRWVRDHQELGTSHHDEAADSIVKAYELALAAAKASGQVAEPPVPTAESLAGTPAAIEVPKPYLNVQAAYDEYAKLVANDASAPTKALAAAMISYRHLQLDDAMARFGAILGKFCHSPEAVQAKEGLLGIYQSRNQNDKFQATADRFISEQCGADKKDVELAKNQKLSNDYQLAVKLFKDGKFEDAGDHFYGLYKTGSEEYKDRPGALFNAALAYEKAGKPKTAIKLYQEFTKIPSFKSSEYYIESLFRTAVSYQNAFDYESAVDTFLQVVEETGAKGAKSRGEFNLDEARLNAMYNAAFLRDLDRVYYDRGKNDPGAATLYLRYAAADTKSRDKSRDSFYNAALVYEKAGSTKDMIKTFEAWRKAYGKDPGAGYKLVYAEWKIAKALEKARDKKGAEDHFKEAIKVFDQSGEKPGSPASELAAEAQFWLAEKYYKATFEPYKVKWAGRMDGKNAEKTVQATVAGLSKIAKETSAGYQGVARFEASWSLAAIVRLGDISFFAGQKFIEAPVPAEILRLDQQYPDQGVLNDYQGFVENLVQPNTDTAKEQWLKAVDTAKKAGVANDWSKLAQQRLNAYIAQDIYQVQRDEMVDREKNP